MTRDFEYNKNDVRKNYISFYTSKHYKHYKVSKKNWRPKRGNRVTL